MKRKIKYEKNYTVNNNKAGKIFKKGKLSSIFGLKNLSHTTLKLV